MGSGAVKTIVLLMVLTVVSVMIGAQASDGVRSGASSLVVIGAIVAFAAMLFMGDKSWCVVFIAPLLQLVFPEKILNGITVGQVLMPAFLVAWILMSIMGTARFKWRGMLMMDLIVGLNFLWYVVSFIRFPVAMEIMQLDYDYIGGKEYLACILATVYYIFYSSIDFPTEKLSSLVRWMFWITLFCGCIVVAMNLSRGAGANILESSLSRGHDHRMDAFLVLGTAAYAYVYNAYPIHQILGSASKLGAMLFAVGSIIISGTREYLVRAAFCMAFFALLKREMSVMVLMGLAVYAGIFVMSQEGLVERLPLGSQRTLLILPGIHGNRSLERTTKDSSDWRTQIWAWALDPRTGYIRDYWFGDGFQASRREIGRSNVAIMRGKLQIADQVDYASRGVWHNGFISCLHRTGVVGVVLAVAFFLTGLIVVVYVARAYGGPGGSWPYMAVLLLPFLEQVFVYFYMGGILDIFFSYQGFALAKVFYCIARERGLLRPLFLRETYVPMTIRSIESAEPQSVKL